MFDLDPNGPFRVVGEQIDGSFSLDGNVYLVEAKWTREKIGAQELYALREKAQGKSQWTRGLFLSINGFTAEGVAAFRTGRSGNLLLVDGAHLFRVLEGHERLDDLLRALLRHLMESGRPYVPAAELKG